MSKTIQTKFNKHNIAPYIAKKIGIFDSNHKMVGAVSLSNTDFKPNFGKRCYRFGILSDLHQKAAQTQTEAYTDFQNALKVFEQKESVNFICTCGDITENGCLNYVDGELKKYAEFVETYAPNTPVYSTTGNHDTTTHGMLEEKNGIKAEDNWLKYVNNRDIEKTSHNLIYAPTCIQTDDSTHKPISFYFTHTLPSGKKDYFIFLSMRIQEFDSDNYNTYYPEDAGGKDMESLGLKSTWIKDILDLAQSTNSRAFVFTHPFFKDKAGNFAEKYPSGLQLTGSQYDYLNNLFDTYPNVIWFSGHSHWKWYLQGADTEQKNNKFLYCNVFHDSNKPNSGYAVHIPSCARPIDSHYDDTSNEWTRDSSELTSQKSSEGGIIDVYEDYIDIRGVSFKSYWNENNYDDTYTLHYQPIGTYRINIANK